jgi:hypothetical protein
MHSPDATWETGLVIPETTKPIDVQTLDALLRIEVLLEELLGQRNVVAVSGDLSDLLSDIEPTETPFLESIKDEKKTKGKRK